MNKYHLILKKILTEGKEQTNKKGNIRYLLDEQLALTPADLLDIFEEHSLARKKLRTELQLFMQGERDVERYRDAGITWWDYCGRTLINSYPTYFEKLPPLIDKINAEKRNSKNYVLFLGSTDAETNQAPCLSLVQFQIDDGELVVSAYQRSSDANLGLPLGYIPFIPDGQANRPTPKAHHPDIWQCTYLRKQPGRDAPVAGWRGRDTV